MKVILPCRHFAPRQFSIRNYKTRRRGGTVITKEFPEIKTVCARIGVADIPTDPMGFDYTDSFIILEKDMSKWKSAKTKEELIEKIKAKLSVLPGLNFSFSQPVELRFNELLTGIREDVAVKLYGDDLDKLNEMGEKMVSIISKIKGAGDVSLERTSGLPQITVKYDHQKIAQYGLNIEKLNQYVSAAFAGSKAGVIFEGKTFRYGNTPCSERAKGHRRLAKFICRLARRAAYSIEKWLISVISQVQCKYQEIRAHGEYMLG